MEYAVTVALPIYNVAPYVEISLLSALNQTFENIEFILVDDKGNDNSMDIVRNIIANHPRGKDVKIIEHDKNIGLGAGRNTAIDNATGKYIFFMDSDDEITQNCIEILYNKMLDTPVDFIAASVEKRSRNGNKLGDYIYKDEIIQGEYKIACNYYNNKQRRVNLWNKLYNLSFLRNNNIKCNPTHLNEDNLFTFQVVLNAQSCRYIPDITYIYYDTPNSIVKVAVNNKISARYAQQYVECIDFKKEYIKQYSNQATREAVFKYIISQTNYFSCKISDSTVLTKNEKKKYLRELLHFPLKFRDIKKFKNKTFMYIMYFVYKFPFTLVNLKAINFISTKL